MKIKKLVLVITFFILILIIFIPAKDITLVNVHNAFFLPNHEYLLGTDHLGRDIFSLIKFGLIRTIVVILTASSISFSLGVFLGVLAGFYEKYLETAIVFLADIFLVVPSFISALIFSSMFGLNPLSCGFLFGITGIGNYLYQVISLTKKIKKEEFIVAQRLLGFSNMYILVKHIIPNILPPILNTFGAKACNVILAYASLSFIGLGADISRPDWGTMLYQYRAYTIDHPILILWPTLGIFIISLSFHILFDSNYTECVKAKNLDSTYSFFNKNTKNQDHLDKDIIDNNTILKVDKLSINVFNLQKNISIIEDLSFSLSCGERLAIVGESGSGKTMLVSSLVNALNSDYINIKGKIFLGGEPNNILNLNEKKRRLVSSKYISFIFQDSINALDPYRKISSQIYSSIKKYRGLTDVDAFEYANELLSDMGLSPTKYSLDKFPHEYSGGMRQRIAIAISLIKNPKIIIADEPSSSLDTLNKKKLDSLLLKFCQKSGIALIYISHDLGSVTQLCQRVLIMQSGKIIEEGSIQTIIETTSSQYTKNLIDSSLSLSNWMSNYSYLPLTSNCSSLILEVKNLSKRYNKNLIYAIKNISFKLEYGDVLGILGESGSGKSTLSQCILKLLKYDGEIKIGNFDIFESNYIKTNFFDTRVQMIFQSPINSFNPLQNMEEALLSAPLYHKIFNDKTEAKDKLLELLKQCGLEQEHLCRYPHQLSGGQLQRMSIIRSLLMRPKLLIADESLSALDVTVQIQILNLLKKIVTTHNLTLIFISHDPKLIANLCKNVLIMKNGTIVESGNVFQIFNHPKNTYTADLLNSDSKFTIPIS